MPNWTSIVIYLFEFYLQFTELFELINSYVFLCELVCYNLPIKNVFSMKIKK